MAQSEAPTKPTLFVLGAPATGNTVREAGLKSLGDGEVGVHQEALPCLGIVFRQSLGWLPDLNHYFATVNRLLSPGGHLFVYEMHPILDMFDADEDLAIRHSYFRSEPFESTDDPDYYDPERIVEATSFWFHHKLSDIIGGCLRHGLALRVFEEHDHDISTVFRSLQDLKKRPPLCYTLVAQKDMILP